MTMRQVIHWLAFGSDMDVLTQIERAFDRREALPYMWNGRAVWTPALGILSAMEQGGDPPNPDEEPNTASLHARLSSLLHQEGLTAAAARKRLEELVSGAEALLHTIETAKSVLWDALVSGRITARGTKPGANARKVEPEFFGTPGVSLTMDGELLDKGEVLYQAVYFITSDVKALWGETEQSALPSPLEEVPIRKGKGGRIPEHDWKAFAREMIRVAALDADGNLTVQAFRRRMVDWAAENMVSGKGTAPDPRTAEKTFNDLLPPGAFPD
jgi:hypothetical protein